MAGVPEKGHSFMADTPARPAIPAGVKRAVALKSSRACPNCGQLFDESNPPELGHVIHRSLGGSDAALNLDAVCSRCNRGRSNRMDEAHRSRQTALIRSAEAAA